MKKSLAYFLLFFAFSIVQAQKASKDPIQYSMENNANWILENPEINSVSIGVYKDGKTYTGYYGEIDKGKENLPNDSTLFEIASVTKTFTGILVAKAVLENKLSLDDDIRKYLNGTFRNLEYGSRPIKIRDLLTHTSGIRRDISPILNKMFDLNASEIDKKTLRDYGRKQLMEDLQRFQLDTLPGTRYDYSPFVGPEILAVILEKVFKEPYGELLEKHILQKVGMTQSGINLDKNKKEQIANGYTDDGKPVAPMPVLMSGAGGSLKSSIPDLLKYISYLLENRNPELVEMRKILFVDEEEGDVYGYFWQLEGTDYMHNGGLKGSTNWVILIPEQNAGFTVQFNSNGNTSGRMINRIANALYNDLENYPLKNAFFPIREALLKNTEEGIALYHSFKKEKSEEFDFKNQSMLNRIGYELLGKDRNEDAIAVFEVLVYEFPEAFNPYDSLGEAYYMNKQYNLSLLNYTKSLELNPNNTNAAQMIKKIKELKK